jgi:hypothetical protein
MSTKSGSPTGPMLFLPASVDPPCEAISQHLYIADAILRQVICCNQRPACAKQTLAGSRHSSTELACELDDADIWLGFGPYKSFPAVTRDEHR